MAGKPAGGGGGGAAPITIGPFSGGLNTLSDESAIEDNQMTFCENFELDLDGSLLSRPPITDTGFPMPLGGTGDMHLLGYFIGVGNVPYLIGTDGLSSTYYFDGTTWHLITSTFAATDFAQFNNVAWLTAPVGSVNPGGSWSTTQNFTPDPNMPLGDTIVAHKFRLWIGQGKNATVNGTRMYFSNLLGGVNPFWPVGPNFLDIGSGDGQNIVKLMVYYGSLLIFRSESIYSYLFLTDPATGIISLLVPNVGLMDKRAVAPFESFIYFLYNNRVYEFLNNRATSISDKIPFVSGSRVGVYQSYSISIFNKRVILSYWDTMYVFNLRTRTWTTWKSPVFGSIGSIITTPPDDGPNRAILHSSQTVPGGGARVAKTLSLIDQISTSAEAFTCTFQTKNYDYQAPSMHKRILQWGANCIYRGLLEAQAIPVSFTKKLTWGQVLAQGITWSKGLLQTWGTNTSDSSIVESDVNSDGASSQRKYVKLGNSFFFRQVSFRLAFTTDGSTKSAPVRVFSLVTYVVAKETVSEEVS